MRKMIAAATLAAGLTVMPVLDSVVVHAQDTDDAIDDDDSDKTGLWGLLGLAGLAGLAGLKRRDVDHRVTTTHVPPTAPPPQRP